jgi:hypothetical protein
MAREELEKIKYASQRRVICRMVIDILRTIHSGYAPKSEPFGSRLEGLLICLCIAIGDLDGRPFSCSKIAHYMQMPRTTVLRKLERLRKLGAIQRRGHHYYIRRETLNSPLGLRSYQTNRRLLSKAMSELSVLDTLPDS